MNKKQFTIFRSIWFWWFLTTSIYIAFGVSGFPGYLPTPLGNIAGFLGLFVPYGYLSLFLFFIDLSGASFVSLVVFVILMFFTDRRLNKENFNFGKRILLNLLILLILTTLVDLIRGTAFMSWIIFFQGAHPQYILF